MREQDPQFHKWIKGISASSLVAWVTWASAHITALEKRQAVVDYKLFNIVAEKPKEKSAPQFAEPLLFPIPGAKKHEIPKPTPSPR